MPRTDSLTTVEMYHLYEACAIIREAFKETLYLVGSASLGGPYRDVDIRLMLDDNAYAAACPTQARWELLSLSISHYLSARTGLKVDFQIQREKEANEKFTVEKVGSRNPLGVGRTFAGGGDGTSPQAVD